MGAVVEMHRAEDGQLFETQEAMLAYERRTRDTKRVDAWREDLNARNVPLREVQRQGNAAMRFLNWEREKAEEKAAKATESLEMVEE